MRDAGVTRVSVQGHDGRLTIDILDLTPNALSHSTAWLNGTVSYRSSQCSFHATSALLVDEVLDFHRELKEMLDTLRGSARLSTVEGTISLDMAMNKRGAVAVCGKLRASEASTAEVIFEFDSDQSYLKATEIQLEEAVRPFSSGTGSR